MGHFIYENTILDRLPMSLSGISFIPCRFTGEVCPKLNIVSKQSEPSLPYL